MSRLADAFARAQSEERAALVVYLCAGDPDPSWTKDLALAARRAGADVLEIGVPFSDPTADGPTIQRASERALQAGTTLRRVLEIIAQIRAESDVPIVLFGYYNPILRYGEEALVRDAKQAGVDGILVVDLPPEHGELLFGAARAAEIDVVPLLAPTSTPARIEAASRVAGSFLYYVSMTGVTGSGGVDLEAAGKRATEIEALTLRPVAIGFGVRTPEDVARVARHASGVVIGSALVEAIAKAAAIADGCLAVTNSVRAWAAATRRD